MKLGLSPIQPHKCTEINNHLVNNFSPNFRLKISLRANTPSTKLHLECSDEMIGIFLIWDQGYFLLMAFISTKKNENIKCFNQVLPASQWYALKNS